MEYVMVLANGKTIQLSSQMYEILLDKFEKWLMGQSDVPFFVCVFEHCTYTLPFAQILYFVEGNSALRIDRERAVIFE